MVATVRVAACQTPDVCADVPRALDIIETQSILAGREGARLVCFPEAFLQGYIVERDHVERHAIELASPAFGSILERLAHVEPMLVFGLIERDAHAFHNSAVVIHGGRLVGRFRKAHLIGKEQELFEPGSEYPLFDLDGVKFSINICYDMRFAEAAMIPAAAGARLLVCPANNMLTRATAEEWKYRHNALRVEHARRAGLWLLPSDVTGTRGKRVSYGPTAVIDPSGTVRKQLPLMTPGTLLWDVPFPKVS